MSQHHSQYLFPLLHPTSTLSPSPSQITFQSKSRYSDLPGAYPLSSHFTCWTRHSKHSTPSPAYKTISHRVSRVVGLGPCTGISTPILQYNIITLSVHIFPTENLYTVYKVWLNTLYLFILKCTWYFTGTLGPSTNNTEFLNSKSKYYYMYLDRTLIS